MAGIGRDIFATPTRDVFDDVFTDEQGSAPGVDYLFQEDGTIWRQENGTPALEEGL